MYKRQRYDDGLPLKGQDFGDRPAAETTRAALEWLKGVELSLIHISEPTRPY